jgi:hypothetical protein
VSIFNHGPPKKGEPLENSINQKIRFPLNVQTEKHIWRKKKKEKEIVVPTYEPWAEVEPSVS